MSVLAVYDAMIFYQWAALPPGRSHATVHAVENGSIRLCVSRASFDEISQLLRRPNIRAKSANLTDRRIDSLLEVIRRSAEWFETVPNHFSYLGHEKDDHLFNLAIASKAKYLVTWESRILKLGRDTTPAASLLRQLAPELSIVSPAELAVVLNAKT